MFYCNCFQYNDCRVSVLVAIDSGSKCGSRTVEVLVTQGHEMWHGSETSIAFAGVLWLPFCHLVCHKSSFITLRYSRARHGFWRYPYSSMLGF
jgi:hypothetical protein